MACSAFTSNQPMTKRTQRGPQYVDDLLRCVYILFPFLNHIIPPKPTEPHVKQCILWIAELSRNLLSECFVIPLLNCFALHIGGRHNFGRALTSVVVLYLFLFIMILYYCLIPRRLFVMKLCSRMVVSECDAQFEAVWFIIHLICSHWFLILVFFHYFYAILLHAGTVPNVLYPEMSPRFSICARCDYPRPPRAHHCNVCGQCVLKMDHHCPWIANCVGLKTHRHFYLALVYMSLGGVYMLTVGRNDFSAHIREIGQSILTKAHNRSSSEQATVWQHSSQFYAIRFIHALSAIYFRIGLIAIPLVFALCCWQTYLITRGETNVEYHTNQRFTRKLQRRGLIYRNPYDFGPFVNWANFLGLYNPTEFALGEFRFKRSTLVWRVITRVLLPSPTVLCEDGLKYRVNTPTVESTLAALKFQEEIS
ncbi:unnamed protein product [Dicrocoelium dendriticum]|nr:unnamed protein product [Dicrocoelium dendriticum]